MRAGLSATQIILSRGTGRDMGQVRTFLLLARALMGRTGDPIGAVVGLAAALNGSVPPINECRE